MFECANPPRPEPKSAANGWQIRHPREWEFQAQQMIRGLAPSVPVGSGPLRVYVAEDAEGIAAVVSWTEVGGPAEVHLDVIGVANRHRRQGGKFTRGIVRAAFQEIEAAAIDAGADELFIECEVFNLNDASLALCSDVQFGLLEEHPTGAQTHTLRIPLPGADFSDDADPLDAD